MHLKCYESHARSFTSGMSGLGVNALLARGLICSFMGTLECIVAIHLHRYLNHIT